MSVQTQLIETYCDNFVAYYTSHACHFNITGRNFYSDHKLLGKIYENLQAEIDVLGEIIRTLQEVVPDSLSDITNQSTITESYPYDADSMLELVETVLQELVASYHRVEEACDDDQYEHISNHAQERVLILEKYIWQLRSTLT
jgi:starvation-inducible DNA-binding protein